MPRLPDLVLVVWDTVRAADVSLLAGGPTTTPVLERLAQRCTVYERASSVAPWTLPSHASLFTGLLPTRHGANETHYRLERGPTTIAELLSERGYETVAVCANDMVSRPAGLGRGFRRFLLTRDALPSISDDRRTPRPARALLRRLDRVYGRHLRNRRDHGAERVNRLVDRALSRVPDDRPVFLFVNVLDAHLPYAPPEPFRTRFLPPGVSTEEALEVNQSPKRWVSGEVDMGGREFEILRALYRGELAYVDARLGQLIRILHRHGRWDRAAFAVTSDHGENIGDHGLMDHQACVYETLLSVPLVVKDAGQTAGRRSSAIVQVHDLGPTLLERAGLAFPEPVHARTLPADGEPGRDAAVSEYVTFFPSLELVRRELPDLDVSHLDRGFRSARDPDDLKLIVDTHGEAELYDLRADPGETTNLAAERPEQVERLRTQLPDWSGIEPVAPSRIEDEIADHLRALGYVD